LPKAPITSLFESRWWRGVFDTTLCDEVCQWLLTSWWFSQTWSHNGVSIHLAMKGARTDNLDMHWLHRYILIQRKIQYTKLLKNKKIIAPFYNADQTNLPKAPITSLSKACTNKWEYIYIFIFLYTSFIIKL
jgi:hypothetical protein